MFHNLKRWRNAGLYISLVSFIPVLLECLGIKVLPEQMGVIKDVLMAIISLLVLLGILNDPTTINRGYSDDKGDAE